MTHCNEDNDLGVEGTQVLSEALKNNATVTELSIWGIFQHFCKQHFVSALNTLTLDDAGAEGVKYLCEALKQNTTLKVLNLQCTCKK